MHLTLSQTDMHDVVLSDTAIARLQLANARLAEAIAILDTCPHFEVAAAYADSALHIVQAAIAQGGGRSALAGRQSG